MKNVLDIYLKDNNTNRYEVAKRANISEQTLSKASKRDPETYTAKTLIAIGKGIGATAGQVLDNLLAIRDSGKLYHATNISELRQKVREQEDEFILEGDFKELIQKIKTSIDFEDKYVRNDFIFPVFEYEGSVLFRVLKKNSSTKDEKVIKKLEKDIVNSYKIKILNDSETLFRLKN
ncbi:hypothetical protein BG261_01325 [Floricoccus tropicus]|uniref:HTH cro/C1-type domain-containing protein n=1 Tax=Floricoccus tropicus TaxID=1859473 RepID=A0A1E8GSG7_9LACT|nr:helix-turn-helix domain-containing protein [Floricoccus tropicus]OFI50543.1 hypothetical protein BG261_01325 [Floricoccus tropicus]